MTQLEISRRSLLDRVCGASAFLAGLAALAVTIMITFDVLMRYFLNKPQLFVDELASFLLVLIIFGGLAQTFQRGGHIQVDLLTNRLSPRARQFVRIFTLSIGIAFLGIVAWNTLISSLVAHRLGRVSMVLFYPLCIPMLLIPIGLALMALVMGVSLFKELGFRQRRGTERQKGSTAESAH